MHRNEPAVGPVHDVQRLLVLRGELGTVAEYDTGWTSEPDIHDRRQRVFVIGRKLAASAAIAEVAATDGMKHSRRPIPRQTPVPLHVAVETKYLAVDIEGDVI